ncbi:MAG: LysM peptidoglycan-binding domain-containing protein [Bacteriovoracaceae bacterium]
MKKLVLPLTISTFASLDSFASADYVQKHKVQEGESLSKIIMQYIQQNGKKVSYSSRPFKAAFKSFEALNPHIKDLNILNIDDEINIPLEFGKNASNIVTSYEVKYGDTVSGILKDILKNENPWNLISVIKHLNPLVKDINLIKQGDKLIIPTHEYLSSLKKVEQKRIPSSAQQKMIPPRLFQSNFLLEEEIYYLDGRIAKELVEKFRFIVDSNTRTDVIKGLKQALEVCRDFEKEHLEQALLSLISMTLKSKESNDYYNIGLFF